jgi:hypothetical protein
MRLAGEIPTLAMRTQSRTCPQLSALCLLVFLLGTPGWSQENDEERAAHTPSQEQRQQRSEEHLNVNFLYGAYVPKEAPLRSLTGHQRAHLFVLQTFTTPGIYVKTTFLALVNQASGTHYEWGGGFEGFGRRAASSCARSSMRNVFSTVGNAALRYEPRYDRCRCVGFGPRTKHALMRNFVTYNETEKELRPQFALYGAAFGAGMLSSLWQPKGQLWEDGFRGVETQIGSGMLSNWIAEFAPEIERRLRRQKPQVPGNSQ